MFLMVIAGNETTAKLLANAAFWRHRIRISCPGLRRPVRVPLWVEETLRYDTSSQILARSCPVSSPSTTPPSPTAMCCCCCPARDTATTGLEVRRLRHRPRHRFQALEFRQRSPLLPGRAPGADGGPGRPHRTVHPHPQIRSRRGELGPRPLEQCPRLRPPTDDRGGPLNAPL